MLYLAALTDKGFASGPRPIVWTATCHANGLSNGPETKLENCICAFIANRHSKAEPLQPA